MRWLVAAVLVFMTTTAQAQQRDLELVRRYVQLPTAVVERWKSRSSDKQSCQLVIDSLTMFVQFIWEPVHPAPVMRLMRRDWKFPGNGIETPVEVLFDDKLLRDGEGAPAAAMMTARDNALTYRWRGDLAAHLEGVQRIGFVFKEGVAFDDSVRVPAVRLLLMGLAECRAELPPAPG